MTMELAIDSIAQSMIARYEQDASFLAVRRAKVLEACNDRRLARTWFLISARIDAIAPPLPNGDFHPGPDPDDRGHAPSAGVDRAATCHDQSAGDRGLVTVD